MELNLQQLKQFKTSDRIYILGSGRSVLDITEEEWKVIKAHDSIGFNHWYVHEHKPTFYDLSYLANDYFDDPEIDMFYQAVKQCPESKFIINHGIHPKYQELFQGPDCYKTHICHFDYLEGDLETIKHLEDTEIGTAGKYWTTDFFSHFNQPFGELLPNKDFIFKSRGQLFATLQLAVLLGYTDIRLIGVDLNDEGKFQDSYDNAPYSAKSVGNGGEKFAPRANVTKNVKDPSGVHNTAQATKDTDYLGIHKLISTFSERRLKPTGIDLSVTNKASLMTTVGIPFRAITEDIQMPKITFCIPSKTNLRYLKTCIPSIRKNAYRKDHDIIIFVDSDEDGTVQWLEENKEELNFKFIVNPDLGKRLFGIGKAYDTCIEAAETDICMIFHADMMLGKNADWNAYKCLTSKSAVCATRIEPPIHPNNGEKILVDFGMWPEEFKEEEFNKYVSEHLEDKKVTDGIFAPWMIYKKEFLDLGGHDPIMHSCREDSDVFNRMALAGFKFRQPWNSLVYHLTGRGAGSFDGDPERHAAWKKDMENSTKEFIRKWGSNVNHTGLMKPIVAPKYDIGFKIYGCNLELLSVLEPWCSDILIEDEMQVLTTHYIEQEQKNTQSNLSEKIKTVPLQVLKNEIVVEIDRATFNQQDFQILQQLPSIIKDSGEVGEFELGNLKIIITQMNEYQNELINVK